MAQATRYEGCGVGGCGDTLKPGWPLWAFAVKLAAMQALNLDYVALGVILAVALFFFWTQKLRTDLTALLVTLALILPWPHPDGHWRSILTYQEGFSGFGSAQSVSGRFPTANSNLIRRTRATFFQAAAVLVFHVMESM
jgi:hypothetical protein